MMLATRVLYRIKLLPITTLSYQTRLNSKITYQDKNNRSKRTKQSSQEKTLMGIAVEGRKLSEFSEESSINPDLLKHSSDIKGKRDSMYSRTKRLGKDVGDKVGRKLSDMEKLDELRSGNRIPFKNLRKRDSTPIFSFHDSSKLFIQPTKDTTISVQRESPFEKDLNESIKYMNSLLYSNPYRDMKEDPYDLNYPANNEDGQPAEKGVSFKDHVILDHFYEGFPKTGEIRNFMEQVITGLSQNAYLTPEEKREHVEWFKKEIATLSPDDIKKMDSYVKPRWIRKRRLKIKVN